MRTSYFVGLIVMACGAAFLLISVAIRQVFK